MANLYVRSTDGSDADNGSTWALAKATLSGAAAIDSAGDVIYVSDAHAESTAGAITIALAGTAASPTKIICGDDAAEPPTTSTTTGTITTTGASAITLTNGGSAFYQGLGFYCGTGTTAANIGLINNNSTVNFSSCHLELVNTGSGASINANGSGTHIHFHECTFKFAAAGQGILFSGSPCMLVIDGGSLSSGGTSPTAFLKGAANWAEAEISGFDLSNASSTVNLCSGGVLGFRTVWKNCRLPASWSGSAASGTMALFERHEVYNCDSADTNYRLIIKDYAGTILSSTSVYNDAGATDGTTRISWEMASGANAEFPHLGLVSPEIVKWNETTGSAITATVEIVHNSQGSGTNGVLNDDECWLEVMYLGTSGVPLGTHITDRKSDVLAAATAQDTSSAAWTGDSAGWDTQKLSVTFTPQEKGFIHARVIVAKASATVYVDPLITVS